ncbi:hypothetical protein MTR67_041209 [Solanum verrucosum]|uniref:P-type Ca(2+) transporter n=1 Tax=Solanum verrucosum TaxID=315347 RepID=A0AAF0ZSW8_SOLVR|nr:hypothetical protein MTR67_041209 [Solanum verrucosum]
MNNITDGFPAEIESSNKKRWHLAFATIYCSRAFKTTYSHGSLAYNPRKVLSVSTDTIAIDVSQQHPFFSDINYSSLAKLVKDKNVDELANLGGVQGVAASLKSDTTNGVVDGYGMMLVTSVDMNTTWGEMMSEISSDPNEHTPLRERLDKLTSSIVTIPEGLPLAVTLTLAYLMKRMMDDKAIVRKLSACETMGSATTICTDKTSTLTLNKMIVTKFFLGKGHIKEESHISISAEVLELFHQGVGLNTTGSVFKSSNPCSSFEFSGSPTEKAILSWAVMELNMDMDQIKRNFNILHVEAFNSEKKKSGVLIKNITDGTIHAHWKSAAEMISRMCSHYYDLEGNVKPLEHSDKEECDRIIEGMAASSLRYNSFILLGFLGLKDPCRPGMKKAVEDCQNAGVNIKMITGDNVFTAKAIATECGILHPNQEVDEGAVIEGEEFRNLTDEERMERIEKMRVMARSSPFDKLLMVQCLRKKGHVVAVTDANFASVATVLKWGRCFYINIQKSIQFQLTENVAALMISFVAAVSSGEVPLTAVQLLWVNLIMDTLGALVLATEKPTEELMKKKPVGRTAPLITNVMWRNLMARALYQIAVLLTLQFKGELIFGFNKRVNETLFFNTFVLCQVFNEFNARSMEKKNVFEGIQKNKLFMGIIGITLVLQVVMVEFLKKALLSTASKIVAENKTELLSNFSRSQSYTVVDIEPECFSSINKQMLAKLVRVRDVKQFDGVESVLFVLKTDADKGILDDVKDIASRRKHFGTNTFKKPSVNLLQILLKSLKDPNIIIVLICWRCIRLKAGDQVPADGIYIGDQSLHIDESTLTKKNDLVEVNNSTNVFLLSGSKVLRGNGRMLVTAVGMDTALAEIISPACVNHDHKSLLQKKLHKLTSHIAKVGLAVSFLVLLVLLVRYFTGNMQNNGRKLFIGGKTSIHDVWKAFLGILATPVAIASGAIPEG